MRSKIRSAMSKESAMSLLGLSLTTEGTKKKARNAVDYSEDDILVAFRDSCSLIGEELFEYFIRV